MDCHFIFCHFISVSSCNQKYAKFRTYKLDPLEEEQQQQQTTTIGGSKGAQGRAPPLGVQIFHFHAVFSKNLKNSSNFGSWHTPLRKILDPPLSNNNNNKKTTTTNNQYNNKERNKIIQVSFDIKYFSTFLKAS